MTAMRSELKPLICCLFIQCRWLTRQTKRTVWGYPIATTDYIIQNYNPVTQERSWRLDKSGFNSNVEAFESESYGSKDIKRERTATWLQRNHKFAPSAKQIRLRECITHPHKWNNQCTQLHPLIDKIRLHLTDNSHSARHCHCNVLPGTEKCDCKAAVQTSTVNLGRCKATSYSKPQLFLESATSQSLQSERQSFGRNCIFQSFICRQRPAFSNIMQKLAGFRKIRKRRFQSSVSTKMWISRLSCTRSPLSLTL